MKLKLKGLDSDLILACAFRYALPRRSYALNAILDILVDHAPQLAINQLDMYIKEIDEYIQGPGKDDAFDIREAREGALFHLKTIRNMKGKEYGEEEND